MNFPPILFYDPRFSKIFSNYPNQNTSSIFSYQNLYKKLLKFENKDNNLQSSVINWLKTLTKIQLVKYFSFNNQWIVDILHQMILISNNNPKTKYIFNPAVRNKDVIISFFNLLNQETLNIYNPDFSEYFSICDSGYINLSKMTEEDKMRRKFIDNIRYLTIPSNTQNNNLNHSNHNNKEKKNEKYFFEYNNVVTLSYDYLSNIDILIENMQTISNNQLFRYPIEIETQYCEYGKYYYNARLSKWLNSQFTLAELLCCYFEQSILINYQYYLLYKQEINFLHYEKLDDLLENIFHILEFIGNANEKKVEIFQTIKKDEIKKFFNENSFIRKITQLKKEKDKDIRLNNIGNYVERKRHTVKEIIDTTMLTLENVFIKSDKNFVLLLTFIKDSYAFHEEDFIIKNAFEKINNFWKEKAAEDLLHELTTNDTKKKKKKRKKKKNNEKKEENKDSNTENNKNQENEIKSNNINDDNNYLENIKKYETKEKNIKDGDINENQKNKIILNDENKLYEKKEESISTKTDNTENYNENKINEVNEKNNKDNNKSDEEINNIENNNYKEESIKEKINEEEENENSNKKKKEKNFFLYPVVKNKKKKNKNKKKEKKQNNNNNIINEKINEDKVDNNALVEKEKLPPLTEEKKNSNENNDKEKNKTELSSKQKNKFNIGAKFNKIHLENDNNNFIQSNDNNQFNLKSDKKEILELENSHNGNNGHFNPSKTESNISRSKENNKYLLAGTNSPQFTSFYFKSKKKGRNHRKKHSDDIKPYSFISNNISELSNEIIENTTKVNENKKILQKLREKYIKKIYEKINIILYNEKIDFLCSFYGSSISGLSIENSDIDIMVKLKQNQNEINYIYRIMDILIANLKNSDINYITNIVPIKTASVPVIKLECDLSTDELFSNEINNLINSCHLNYNEITKLFFDITFFEVENEKNKIPSELMIDYIKETLILFPQIIDIIYIMKRFLFNKKLNKSYQGGISSYSLFLLILAFIKYYKSNYDIPLGSLLIEFLYYYSNFNFYDYEILPNKNDENEIFILNEKNSIYKYNINIKDPITGINVAKSTFKIEEIKNAFKEGYNIIIGNLYKINRNNESENNKKIIDNFLAK